MMGWTTMFVVRTGEGMEVSGRVTDSREVVGMSEWHNSSLIRTP